MESWSVQPVDTVIKWCDCGCDCCSAKRKLVFHDSSFFIRSVKRKLAERDDADDVNALSLPGLSTPNMARVDIRTECIALREMVNSQQETIQDLSIELDKERNAASSAANEAMSMILRLQSEKSEAQMEARQFKRFSEEKMAHDQQEIIALEDLLYQREQTIEALTYEAQAYKHRMLSYGFTELEADGENNNYPPLKCKLIEKQADPYHESELIDKELVDDTCDRIYTVDAVHNVTSFDDDLKAGNSQSIGVTEIKKLYARLHALEADRESMKQALISMRTENAQLVLLKEIAQHLYKDVSPRDRMPVKKQSVFRNFPFVLMFKWIVSFVFWRRVHRSKYMFGMSASNAGLRMLVSKAPQMGQWRCLSRTRFLKY